jgi:dihydroflavonol-4-reductase
VANAEIADTKLTLITGATGFIGRHCVRALLQPEARLRVLCRDAEKARRLFGTSVEVVEGDLLNPASLAAACRGVHTVFNLAGSYEFGPAHRAKMWRVNVDGTENLLAACWQARVGRVVHCSTAGILSASGKLISSSDFPPRPPTGCHYKQSKWHGEARALHWAGRGLPVVIASPTAPVGAGDERPTPTGRMFLDLLRGRFPACTRTGLNIIAVQDLAAGLLAVGRQGQTGQRYVLGGENIWLGDLMALAAAAGRCAAPRLTVPWLVVALGGLAGEVWGRMSGKTDSRLCWETAYFARQRQFFDLQPTLTTLDWRPKITTKIAVTEAVNWFANFSEKIPAAPVAAQCPPISS